MKRSLALVLGATSAVLLVTVGLAAPASAASAASASAASASASAASASTASASAATAATASAPGTIVQFDSTFPVGPAANAAASVPGTASTLASSSLTKGIWVSVTGKTPDTSYEISVTPPTGKALAAGRYSGLNTSDTSGTNATLRVDVGSTSETVSDGYVDILDLSAHTNGLVKSFDIVFGISDDSPLNAVFGEMRFGETQDLNTAISARHIEWPLTAVHSTPITATEWVSNTSSTAESIGAVAVTSGRHDDFVVANDTCSRKTLAAGARCSFTVGFSPVTGGPRDAELTFAVNGVTDRISLSGNAPLGTNSLVTSGTDYVDGGATHSYTAGDWFLLGWNDLGRFDWTPVQPYADSDALTVRFVAPNDGALAVGTHKAVNFTEATSSQYGETISGLGRGCGDSTGTITVQKFTVTSTGEPDVVDLSFTQKCSEEKDPSKVMTGTLKYHDRSDVTPPAAVTALGVSTTASGASGVTRTVNWKASTSSDVAYTAVRLVGGDGSNATPTSGVSVSASTATSATLPALQPGARYTVVAFAIDTSGNYSVSAAAAVTG